MKHFLISLISTLLIGFASIGVYTVVTNEPEDTVDTKSNIKSAQSTVEPITAKGISGKKIISLVNKERAKLNIAPLTENTLLNESAMLKCKDMAERNYWSHTDPQGREPWIFMNQVGYFYYRSGENIAYGYPDETQLVSGWMGSPTHKDNILDTGFTETGVASCDAENYQGEKQTIVNVHHFGQPL